MEECFVSILVRWAMVALLFLLGACAAAPASQIAAEPTLAPLPSVTPVPPREPAATVGVVVLPTAQTAVPTVTPQPSAVPAVVETADGPVTATMARLNIAAEPYATLGDPNAPVTVVEFADFGCEFCGRYHALTFGAIKAEYIDTGQVYYVYKDLPVTSRHGALAAQAAECAGAQGQYWAMHDALFAEPRVWSGSASGAIERIRAAAAEIGLTPESIAACVVAETYTPNIERNFAEAQALRIYGTPAFFINGKLLAGAHSIAVWREILDEELVGVGQAPGDQ
jgi:protein-disulfide isomerase